MVVACGSNQNVGGCIFLLANLIVLLPCLVNDCVLNTSKYFIWVKDWLTTVIG